VNSGEQIVCELSVCVCKRGDPVCEVCGVCVDPGKVNVQRVKCRTNVYVCKCVCNEVRGCIQTVNENEVIVNVQTRNRVRGNEVCVNSTCKRGEPCV